MTTLQAIYDRIPEANCKGLCHGACGPIGIFPKESQRIMASGHPNPKAINSLRHGPLTCSALDRDRRCRIYQNRPVICRLYGVVPALRCEHGCEPERWLTDKEAAQIMKAIEDLGTSLDGMQPILTI